MDRDWLDSVVLVTSSETKNSDFGTGFVIHCDEQAAFVLTCAHVVKAVGGPGTVKVNTVQADVVASGPDSDVDLAVLRVIGLDKMPLPLAIAGEKGKPFTTAGFHFEVSTKEWVFRPLHGFLGEQVKIGATLDKLMNAWDLIIRDEYSLLPGNSGSPVIDIATNAVVGVVRTRQGGQKGLAISIEALENIWTDMPHNHLKRSPVDIHERVTQWTPLEPRTRTEKYTAEEKQAPSQIPLLDIKSIQPVTQLIGHTKGVTALALSPDNQFLVSGDEKGKVKIWDIAKRTSFTPDKVLSWGTKLWPWGLNPVTSIVFHPEGRTFLVGWRNGEIKLWKCNTGEFIQSIPMWRHNWGLRTSKGVEALAIAPDGLVIIIAGQAVEYEVQGGGESQAIIYADWSLKWREYPKTDKNIVAEDYPYIEKFGHYDCEEETPSIAFSPKGRFFAASSSTGIIRIWDISQGIEGSPLRNKAGSKDLFTSITFHPNENLLAAINEAGQYLIWDVSTGTMQNPLPPLSGKITAIAFSPDGHHLAAAHSSGIIGFWSSSSGELLHSFQAHDQSIPALVYSHDGYTLVSGSLDKTIKVWRNH